MSPILTVVCGAAGRRIPAAKGENLLEALRGAGFFIDAPCGGGGTCGKCSIRVGEEWRRACGTTVEGDITVTLPADSSFLPAQTGVKAGDAVETQALSPVNAAAGDARCFGLAVDLGTTTISMALLDLGCGLVVDALTFYNPQIVFGADVITRIMFSLKDDGRRRLQESVAREMDRAIRHLLEAHRISREEIRAVAVAGNTTMQHLLLGLDARFIREEPFQPITTRFPVRPASGLFPPLTAGELHLLPCVANYLGADMVAGAAACGLSEGAEPGVLLDIGTNGEIMIGNGDWLMGCACSAGPAFEGMGLSCGMRFKDGAVTDARAEAGRLAITVEGGRFPAGISGTGAIALVAGLKDLGRIDGRGRFTDKAMETVGSRRAFILHRGAGGNSVSMDEPDIDNIIRAKAAIFAGLTLMLKKLSLGVKDIGRFMVAGGIGSSLPLESAVKIGLLPPIPRDRLAFRGNTSLQGAMRYLLSEGFRRKVAAIADMTTYVDLGYEPSYMEEFVAALFIPHTDRRLFAGG